MVEPITLVRAFARASENGEYVVTEAQLLAQATRANEVVEKLTEPPMTVLLCDPVGTGKTIVTLAAALAALDRDIVDHVVVEASNSDIRTQWLKRAGQMARGVCMDERVPDETVAHGCLLNRVTESPGCFWVVETNASSWQDDGTQRDRWGDAKVRGRRLVIVDEAHTGLQGTEGHPATRQRNLEMFADGSRAMLLTATPFKTSGLGLLRMLSVADPDSGPGAISAQLDGAKNASIKVTTELRRSFGDAQVGPELDGPRQTWREGVEPYCLTPYRFDEPGHAPKPSLPTVTWIEPDDKPWWSAYPYAVILARLLTCLRGSVIGLDDSNRQAIRSSNSAFWNYALGTELRGLSTSPDQPDEVRELARLVQAIRNELPSGEVRDELRHPKVAATVEWAASKAKEGRNILVFARFLETKQVLIDALEVELPDRVHSADAVRSRDHDFRKDGGLGHVAIATARSSEGIDLDGGRPLLAHHDLLWSPAQMVQRWGRVVRISSGYEQPEEVFVPVLDVPEERRMWEVLSTRWKQKWALHPAMDPAMDLDAIDERPARAM